VPPPSEYKSTVQYRMLRNHNRPLERKLR